MKIENNIPSTIVLVFCLIATFIFPQLAFGVTPYLTAESRVRSQSDYQLCSVMDSNIWSSIYPSSLSVFPATFFFRDESWLQ